MLDEAEVFMFLRYDQYQETLMQHRMKGLVPNQSASLKMLEFSGYSYKR